MSNVMDVLGTTFVVGIALVLLFPMISGAVDSQVAETCGAFEFFTDNCGLKFIPYAFLIVGVLLIFDGFQELRHRRDKDMERNRRRRNFD